MDVLGYLLYALLAVVIITVVYLLLHELTEIQFANGQSVVKTDGLRQLPQDYYITTTPPVGIQQTNPAGVFSLENIIQTLTGAGLGGTIAKFLDRKQEKDIKDSKITQQQLAETDVKQAIIQKEALKLQYDKMGPEEANKINDRPEIKLENVAKVEAKAVEIAAKTKG